MNKKNNLSKLDEIKLTEYMRGRNDQQLQDCDYGAQIINDCYRSFYHFLKCFDPKLAKKCKSWDK